MSTDLIKSVIYLIESGKGDVGRLNYILNVLQDGKILFASDKKYLDTLISSYIDSSKRREIGILAGNESIIIQRELLEGFASLANSDKEPIINFLKSVG